MACGQSKNQLSVAYNKNANLACGLRTTSISRVVAGDLTFKNYGKNIH